MGYSTPEPRRVKITFDVSEVVASYRQALAAIESLKCAGQRFEARAKWCSYCGTASVRDNQCGACGARS